jgi:hypothetical protein
LNMNNSPYAQKKPEHNGADFKVILRRCANSDEWLVVAPDFYGEPVVLVATSRELKKFQRLQVIAVGRENRVLRHVTQRQWRAFLEGRL